MVDPSQRYVPAFVSPLTHDQHAQLGRIAVLWGYCDFLLDELLTHVIGVTIEQRNMLIGEKPIGGKLDLMKQKMDSIADPEIRADVQAFHRIMNQTKQPRNSAFHGCWGWKANERLKKAEICSRHPKALENPVRPMNLITMEKQLCEASRLALDATARLHGWDTWSGSTRFLHGVSDGPPEWLIRWTERDPLRHAILDHSRKEGELPHLAPKG